MKRSLVALTSVMLFAAVMHIPAPALRTGTYTLYGIIPMGPLITKER
jgi:hypothetical protein